MWKICTVLTRMPYRPLLREKSLMENFVPRTIFLKGHEALTVISWSTSWRSYLTHQPNVHRCRFVEYASDSVRGGEKLERNRKVRSPGQCNGSRHLREGSTERKGCLFLWHAVYLPLDSYNRKPHVRMRHWFAIRKQRR